MCSNYREITAISSVGRLYGRILNERIALEYEDMKEPNGSRAGISCTSNIFVLKQLIKNGRYGIYLTTCCLQIQGRHMIWYVQTQPNIYKNTRSVVKDGSFMSQSFLKSKGLKQDYCLSPTLFKFYIESVLEQQRNEVSGMGKHRVHVQKSKLRIWKTGT